VGNLFKGFACFEKVFGLLWWIKNRISVVSEVSNNQNCRKEEEGGHQVSEFGCS
jgi:hypothetical protein